jgi:hypothetical protein
LKEAVRLSLYTAVYREAAPYHRLLRRIT